MLAVTPIIIGAAETIQSVTFDYSTRYLLDDAGVALLDDAGDNLMG